MTFENFMSGIEKKTQFVKLNVAEIDNGSWVLRRHEIVVHLYLFIPSLLQISKFQNSTVFQLPKTGFASPILRLENIDISALYDAVTITKLFIKQYAESHS